MTAAGLRSYPYPGHAPAGNTSCMLTETLTTFSGEMCVSSNRGVNKVRRLHMMYGDALTLHTMITRHPAGGGVATVWHHDADHLQASTGGLHHG